jgi:hypothetical protein
VWALQERIEEDTHVPSSQQAMHSTREPRAVIQLTQRINQRVGDIIAVWNALSDASMAEGLRRHRAGAALVALSELNASACRQSGAPGSRWSVTRACWQTESAWRRPPGMTCGSNVWRGTS